MTSPRARAQAADGDGGRHVPASADGGPSPIEPGNRARTALLAGGQAGPAGVGGPGPAPARALAYRAAALPDVAPPSPQEQQRLGEILGDVPVYGWILERDRKQDRLTHLRETIEERLGPNRVLATGERPAGGAPIGPEELAPLQAEAGSLSADVADLDARIDSSLARLGTTRQALRLAVEEDFPTQWCRRARAVLDAVLDANEREARGERARYGVGGDDVPGLLRADRRLGALQAEVDGLEHRAGHRVRDATPLLAGLPEAAAADVAALATVERRRTAARRLAAARAELGARYPVLLTPAYRPGAFGRASPEQVAAATGSWADDVLRDIAATRVAVDDGRLLLWDMRVVPELTWQALGVPATGPLGAVMEQRRERQRSEKAARERAFAALAFTAGLVATVATLGGAAVVATIAGGVAAGVGVRQLVTDAGTATALAAAEGTALDRELGAVSAGEPELLPIIWDLIGLTGDVTGLAGLAGQLAGLTTRARAVHSAGRALIAAAPAASAPEQVTAAVARYQAWVAGQLGDAAVAARVAADVGVRAQAELRFARAVRPGRGVGPVAGRAGRTGVVTRAVAIAALERHRTMFGPLVKHLMTDGRICLMERKAVLKHFSFIHDEEAVEGIWTMVREELAGGSAGFYWRGTVFVARNTPEEVASTLVQEGVHWLQAASKRELTGFQAEFEGHIAEREFARHAAVDGWDLSPAQRHLLPMDDAAVAEYVEHQYLIDGEEFRRPPDADFRALTDEFLRWFTELLLGPGSGATRARRAPRALLPPMPDR